MKLKFHNLIKNKLRAKKNKVPLKIKKNQIYILPTRPGFIFLLVVLVIFAGSFNENNNMGLLFSFFLFFIFLFSTRETRNSILDLKINSIKIENSFAFSKTKVEFNLLTNGKEKKAVKINLKDKFVKIEFLKNNLNINAKLFIDSKARGIYRCPVFKISSSFPYGIFKSFAYFYSDEKQIVYPSPSKTPIPLTKLKSLMEIQGKTKDKNKDEDEFKGLKNYVKGDNIKRISWKSYSKGLGLFIKDFNEEKSFDKIIIYFDKLKIENLEKKLSKICKTILELEAEGLKYGLEIKQIKIPPNSGPKHQKICLELLAGYDDE